MQQCCSDREGEEEEKQDNTEEERKERNQSQRGKCYNSACGVLITSRH